MADVGHAAVAQLDCVPVEYFVEVVVAWEVSVQYIEELAANVGGDVGAEGWVEPGDNRHTSASLWCVKNLIHFVTNVITLYY